MNRTKQFPKLNDQIILACGRSNGLSSPQIHAKISEHYQFGAAPSKMTVFRHIQTLISQRKLVEGDDGYKAAVKQQVDLERMLSFFSEDMSIYLREILDILVMLNKDWEGNQDACEKASQQLCKRMESVEFTIRFINMMAQNIEVIAAMARSHPALTEWVKENPNYLDDEFFYRRVRDSHIGQTFRIVYEPK